MSHFDISAAILGINIWDIDIGNIGIFFYFGDIIEKIFGKCPIFH
jgi:membrane associated rhomboid family serine protease